MKNKLILYTVVTVILTMIVVILLGACQPEPSPAPQPSPGSTPTPAPTPAAETIKLKGITAFPPPHSDQAYVPLFVEMLNTRTNGAIEVEWLGGPEVIAAFDQGAAVKDGVVDMLLFEPCGYLTSLVPEAGASCLAMAQPWEERDTGAYALWDKIYQEKLNAKFLGEFQSFSKLNVYGNFIPKSVADFKGKPIRVSAAWIPWITAIGASPVTIAPNEIYTSMERKVVDGFVWLNRGISGWGLHEVTKYRIDPGLFQSDNGAFMNLDKWNSLPQNVQDMITSICIDMEYMGAAVNQLDTEKEMAVIEAAGMTVVSLPAAEAKKYVQLGYDATWANILEKAPDYGPELKKVLSITVPRYGSK